MDLMDQTPEKNPEKLEKDDHLAFVRKVLGIVAAQLAFTLSFCVLTAYNEALGSFLNNLWILIPLFILLIVLMLTLYCSKTLRRKVPHNYILLAAITVVEALYVGAITATYSPESVLLAIGVTAATVASLFVTAMCTPASQHLLKFLIIGLILSAILQVMFLVSLFFLDSISNQFMILYATIGCLASGIFVLVDLVLIMKPGMMDMEDYILGALSLYLDIVRLFIYILMLLGKRN